MSEVTQTERSAPPKAKSSAPSSSTAPGRVVTPEQGHRAQAQRLVPVENLEDFGPVRTRKATAELEAGEDGTPVGRLGVERGSHDIEGLGARVATAEIARSAAGELSGKIGRRQSLEQDELRIANEQSLRYEKGQGTLEAAAASRYRDAEGTLQDRRVSGELGYGEAGAVVGLEGSKKSETDAKKRAATGKARWSKADGVEVEGAYRRELKDDVGSEVREAKVGYGRDDGVSVEASHSRTLSAVEGHELTTAHGVKYGDERVELSRATRATWEQKQESDGEVERVGVDKALKVGFGKGGVGGEATRNRVVKRGDGTMSRTTKAGYDHETGDATLGDTVTHTDAVSTRSTARHIGYGKDGLNAKLERERTLGDKSGDHLTSRAGASYEDGNLTLSRGETASVSGDDGKTATGSGQRLVVGKDGVSFGHDQKRTVVDADGASTTRAVGVTGDVTKGQLGIEASSVRKDKDGREASSISGGGNVKVGKDGVESVSGQAAYKKGKTTIAASAGYSFVVEEPVQVERGGRLVWQMTVRKELSGGASVSIKGVGGGVSESAAHSMSIVRDSREELLAMRQAGKLEAELRKPADARTVTSMRAGDQRSSGSASTQSVSAEVGLGALKVGFQFKNGKSQTVTVTKQSGSLVQVRFLDAESSGVSGSVQTVLGGFGAGSSRTSSRVVTLEFDLSSREGLTAFETFRDSGVKPKTGARLVSETEASATASETTASLLGISLADSSSVSKAITVDEDGRTEKDVGQRAQTMSVPLLGSHQKSVGFELIEKDDRERSYRATATVSSARASDGAEALADATGTHTNRGASGEGSGVWNVSAEFSEAQIENLIRLVRHDKVVYAELFRQRSEGDVLRRAVVAAGDDHDKIREALAHFVSKTGARGLAIIRKALDARPSYDVELVGDKYLTGEKVRLEIAQKKADFEARAGQDSELGALLADLDESIAYHRARAAALESHKNYPELTHQLRATEVERSRQAIAHYGALRKRVSERAHSKRESAESATPTPSAEQSFVEPSEAVSIAPHRDKECERPSPEVAERADAWREVGVARTELEGHAIPEVERAFAEARRRHWVHGGAYSPIEPRSKLGFDNLFGSGKHATDYEQAEARLDFGKFQLGTLTALKNALLGELAAAERANLGGTPPPAAAVRTLAARLLNLSRSFRTAAEAFRKATGIYRRIEAANPTLRKWEPTEEMPDGYHR